MTTIFDRIVAILASSGKEKGLPPAQNNLHKRKRSRTCRIEELEAREMLSAIALDFGFDAVDTNSDTGPANLFSAVEIGATAALIVPTPTITSIDVVNSTTLSVGLSGGGKILGYTIQIATDSDFTQNARTLDVGIVPQASITGLTAGTLYYVRVKSRADTTGDTPEDPTVDSPYSGWVREKTPSTVVTSLDDYVDDGSRSISRNSISLREAIYYAGKYDLGTTITFASSLNDQTITATTYGAVEINENITINGTGSNITFNGTFSIASGSTAAIQGLTIRGAGNGIDNGGSLTVTNCTITGNGGSGMSNSGTLTVTNCTITENGQGGLNSSGTVYVSGGTVSSNNGDGISGSGTVSLSDATVSSNRGGFGINTGSGILNVSNCTITENGQGGLNSSGTVYVSGGTVSGNNGNGILGSGGNVEVAGTEIRNNRAGFGIEYTGSNTLTVMNCPAITENQHGGISCSGSLDVSDSTISDNGYIVTEDGYDITGTHGGIYCNGNSAAVTNCTIAGNRTLGSGGGVYISSETSAVTNCTITDNMTTVSAGGIYINSGETSTVTNCTITGNSAANGGGVYTSGSGTVTVGNCMITDNSATNQGGGIYNSGSQTIVTGCTVSNNSTEDAPAQSGGGIYNLSGTLTLSGGTAVTGHTTSSHGAGAFNGTLGTLIINANCEISGNSASGSGGGVYSNGTLSILGGTITGNSADIDGGGIYSGGTLNVSNNSTVTENSATDGGGIYTSGESAAVANSTVSYNSATNHGGGIYSGGSLNVSSGTISFNSAVANGGGIFSSGSLNMTSGSTVTRNSATNGGGIYNSGASAAVEMSTISNNSATNQGGGMYTSGTQITVTNCTVSNNNNTAGNPTRNGGGIYNSSGTLTLSGGSITGHTTSSHGAGIFNDTAGSLVIDAGCNVSRNSTPENGGGLYNIGIQARVSNGTITNNSAVRDGGGIYSGTTLIIENVSTVSNNQADRNGGGIYNSAGGTLSIDGDSRVENNSAISNGGGVYNDISCSLTISNSSRVNGNSAIIHGGGIFNGTDALLSMSGNSMVFGNSAVSFGGGIYNISTRTNSVSDCMVSANSAIRNGGGIYSSGVLTVSNSTFAGNVSYNRGGGISNIGTLTVSNSTFTENEAYNRGGGISNDGALEVTACLIAGNLGVDMGGGVYNGNASSIAVITNCTIAGNSGDSGGGIYFGQGAMTIAGCTIAGNAGFNYADNRGGGICVGEGDLTINNSIVAQNSSDINGDIDYGAHAVISGNNNLIGDGSVLYHLGDDTGNSIMDSISTWLNQEDGNIIGTAENPVDPMFVAFTQYELWSSNQWQSMNLRLAEDSPAIVIGAGVYAHDPSPFLLAAPILGTVVSVGDNAVSITWSAVPGAGNYAVQYATDPDFTAAAGVVVTNSLWTTIYGLNSGTVYYVRVMATQQDVDFFLTSDYSEMKSVTTGKIKLSEPELGSVAAMGTDSIRLSWNDVFSADGYIIEYASDAKFTVNVGRVETSASSYTLTGLYSNLQYYVRVKAIGTGDYCDSDYSEVRWASTEKLFLAPPALDDLVASGITVYVTWDAVPNASGYVVECAADEAFTIDVASVNTADTSVILSELNDSTLYYVRVSATDIGGYSTSDYSAVKLVATEKVYLTAPILGEPVATGNSLTVTWDDVEDASGYAVEYASDETFTADVGTAGTTAASMTITGLRTNTLYYVRVMAIGAGYENSQYSAVVSATTLSTPDLGTSAPIKPVVRVDKKATTVRSVTLTWTVSTKNADYIAENYVVTCVSHPEIPVTPDMIVITGKKAVLTIGNLDPKTKYKFSIVAVNGTEESKPVSLSATTAKYTAVRYLKSVLAAKTADSVTLTWKPSTAKADTDGYVVEVYDAAGKVFLDISIPIDDVNTTTITVSGLEAKTKYTFVVKAVSDTLTSVAAKIKVTTRK